MLSMLCTVTCGPMMGISALYNVMCRFAIVRQALQKGSQHVTRRGPRARVRALRVRCDSLACLRPGLSRRPMRLEPTAARRRVDVATFCPAAVPVRPVDISVRTTFAQISQSASDPTDPLPPRRAAARGRRRACVRKLTCRPWGPVGESPLIHQSLLESAAARLGGSRAVRSTASLPQGCFATVSDSDWLSVAHVPLTAARGQSGKPLPSVALGPSVAHGPSVAYWVVSGTNASADATASHATERRSIAEW